MKLYNLKAGLKVPIDEDMPNLAAWFARVTARPTARA